jgi:hypothetical protein
MSELFGILKSNIEFIKNFIEILAILIGGGWAFWRFILQREAHSKIQFNLDLRVLGIQKDKYIVEIIAIVENKGLVRHYINDFRFDLLYLSKEHKVIEGDRKINRQVQFIKLINKRYWIPPDWYYSFIDPGITQNYTYVTHLPIESRYALIYALFKYPDKKSGFHTAQKVFKIELSEEE